MLDVPHAMLHVPRSFHQNPTSHNDHPSSGPPFDPHGHRSSYGSRRGGFCPGQPIGGHQEDSGEALQ